MHDKISPKQSASCQASVPLPGAAVLAWEALCSSPLAGWCLLVPQTWLGVPHLQPCPVSLWAGFLS